MHGIMMKFVDDGPENCLVLEDDADFRNMDHLEQALMELPEDWLTLHLGGNATDGVSGMMENQPEAFSKHLVRLKCAWTSQAIVYRRPVAEMIVLSYDPETKEMYDEWLSRNILRTNPCFMIRPTIAWQRPGRSDLWGVDTDYTGAWEATDRKIMAL
jgi:hypothetical protein